MHDGRNCVGLMTAKTTRLLLPVGGVGFNLFLVFFLLLRIVLIYRQPRLLAGCCLVPHTFCDVNGPIGGARAVR